MAPNDQSIVTAVVDQTAFFLKSTPSPSVLPTHVVFRSLSWTAGAASSAAKSRRRRPEAAKKRFVWKKRVEAAAKPGISSSCQGVLLKQSRVHIVAFPGLMARTGCQVSFRCRPRTPADSCRWPFTGTSPLLAKRQVENTEGGGWRVGGGALARAEQEEWGSHGQGLINEPLI